VGTSPKTGDAERGEDKTSSPQEALPMPHERDQAAGGVDPRPKPVIQQAHKDLQQGQVDTDLHGTPGLDAEHRKKLVNDER